MAGHYIIREFESHLDMDSFYSENKKSFFIDLDVECPRKYYGIDFLDEEKSYFFCSDDLCKLQVIYFETNSYVLIDKYFIILSMKDNSKKIVNLFTPGDSMVYKNNRIFIIYETGMLLYNPNSKNYKYQEVKDLIVDWKFLTDATIELQYEDKSTQKFSVLNLSESKDS